MSQTRGFHSLGAGAHDNALYGVNLRTGAVEWRQLFESPITAAAAVDPFSARFINGSEGSPIRGAEQELICACGSKGEGLPPFRMFLSRINRTNSLDAWLGGAVFRSIRFHAACCKRPVKQSAVGDVFRSIFTASAAVLVLSASKTREGGADGDHSRGTDGDHSRGTDGDSRGADGDQSRGADGDSSQRLREVAGAQLGGDVFSSPVLLGGRVWVGCRDNFVYCLDLDVS
eukprot:12354-Prorocentrum_minimum.AAC.2